MTKSIAADPIQALVREHRCIEVLLDCLGALARETRRRGCLDVSEFGQILAALERYVEAIHHQKEARWLFPRIEARGLPPRLSRSARVLAEHATGQADLEVMRVALAAAAGGNEKALDILLEHAEHYARNLRRHIEDEDRVLLPLADAVLREEDRRELLEQFAALDADVPPRSAGLARTAQVLALRLRIGVGPGFRNAGDPRLALGRTPASPA